MPLRHSLKDKITLKKTRIDKGTKGPFFRDIALWNTLDACLRKGFVNYFHRSYTHDTMWLIVRNTWSCFFISYFANIPVNAL